MDVAYRGQERERGAEEQEDGPQHDSCSVGGWGALEMVEF